jgi:Amt family ammonium transporter
MSGVLITASRLANAAMADAAAADALGPEPLDVEAGRELFSYEPYTLPISGGGGADGEVTPDQAIYAINHSLDTLWVLVCAFLVFFMQAGFAALEAGSVRAKNTKNILLKNVIDACAGALMWWALGFPFAFGNRFDGSNGWIGANNFFLAQYDQQATTPGNTYPIAMRNYSYTDETLSGFAFWLFQWAFAATAATIVSGAVAERCRFVAYLIYTAVITMWIYPVVVHWVWSSEGWLSAFFVQPNTFDDTGNLIRGTCTGVCNRLRNGVIDFAGSGVVHMTGGTAALFAAWILGPRIGRFDSTGAVQNIPAHSLPLATLGVFILWFGWYGFNCGSTLGIIGGLQETAAKVAVVTTLAAGAGGVTSLALSRAIEGHIDLAPSLNGILGGLVASCAGCATVEPFAGMVIGIVAGIIYVGSSKMLKAMRIDDPLDASPVHFFCGIWGLWACGLLSTYTNVSAVYGDTTVQLTTGGGYWGGFYGGGGTLLGVNIISTLAIAAWVGINSCIMFGLLKVTGLFRVSEEDETVGMDISHHGGSAYEWQSGGPPDGGEDEDELKKPPAPEAPEAEAVEEGMARAEEAAEEKA